MARTKVTSTGAVHGHEHPGNPCIRSFGVGRRTASGGKPSGTMISSGGASATPLIRDARASHGDGAYARLIAKELPHEAPARKGMRLASFFCGAGGVDLGFRSAGFELAFANDYYDKAAATFGRNLGHAPVLSDIRLVNGQHCGGLGEVDVVTGGFPCFPAGTLVRTARGDVPIEEVSVGDEVLTHAGRFRRVSVVMAKDSAPIVEVRAMGAPPLETTPEHPFWARLKVTHWRNGHPVREWGPPAWVDALDLTRDHFIAQPVDSRGDNDDSDSALWYLVGRWLGDGWIVNHLRKSKVPAGKRGSRVASRVWEVIVCCARHEAEDLARRIEAAGYAATRADERTVTKFHICSRALVEFLAPFGQHAGGKLLPEGVFGLSAPLKEALFRGWLDSDGCDVARSSSGTTISARLAHGMARLARAITRRAVSLSLVKKQPFTTIEGRVVRQRPQYRVTIPIANREAFVADDVCWVPVRSVTPTGEKKRVHNLEVEGDNSYVAGSYVVHNCVTFSLAGRRAGVVDDMNGKLYMELCRVITEINPRYFVAENVAGMLTANGGNAIKLVLAAFLRLGYRTSYELVNMAEHGVPQTRRRVIFVGVRLDQWRGSFIFPRKSHRLPRLKDAREKWLPPSRTLREAIGDLGPPNEKLIAGMPGDTAAKIKVGKYGATQYNNSKPRDADLPAHPCVASGPGEVLARTALEARVVGVPNPDYANPVRTADGPCVTVVSSEPPELTLRMNHDPNDSPLYGYNQTRRRDRDGAPCPTVDTKEQNASWIDGHESNNAKISDTHAMSKRIARSSSSSSSSPTIVSEATNVQPVVVGLRRMTVRECARVQSFPDWYVFEGSQADGYRQIGNAVPPLYAKRLAEAILEYDARRRA